MMFPCNFTSLLQTSLLAQMDLFHIYSNQNVHFGNCSVLHLFRLLFWIRHNIIESCTLSGSNFRTNISIPETHVRFISLDLSARRVYYVVYDNTGHALQSVDYMGSDFKKHFRLSRFMTADGLGVFRGYVYWVSFDKDKKKDIIYQAPLNLTDDKQVQVLSALEEVSFIVQGSSVFLARLTI